MNKEKRGKISLWIKRVSREIVVEVNEGVFEGKGAKPWDQEAKTLDKGEGRRRETKERGRQWNWETEFTRWEVEDARREKKRERVSFGSVSRDRSNETRKNRFRIMNRKGAQQAVRPSSTPMIFYLPSQRSNSTGRSLINRFRRRSERARQ